MSTDNVPDLWKLAPDIIRRIIQVEKPDSFVAIRSISRVWNSTMHRIFEENKAKPTIQLIRCFKMHECEMRTRIEITIKLTEANTKHIKTLLADYAYSSLIRIKWKKDSVRIVALIMRKQLERGKRKRIQPKLIIPDRYKIGRLANLLWRFGAIEEVELSEFPYHPDRLAALRRCLTGVPIRKLSVTFDEYMDNLEDEYRENILKLIPMYSMQEYSIHTDVIKLDFQEFVATAMPHLRSLQIYSRFTAFERSHQHWVDLMRKIAVPGKLEANYYTKNDPLVKRENQVRKMRKLADEHAREARPEDGSGSDEESEEEVEEHRGYDNYFEACIHVQAI